MDGTTAYEFSGDGNGALLLPNVTYEFTYKIKKDQISIDYENESVRDGAYTFSVDKDKLTLIGGEGTVGGTTLSHGGGRIDNGDEDYIKNPCRHYFMYILYRDLQLP